MIQYLKGDATSPVKDDALIVHVCNNCGGWGAGFVLAISKKWPEPEKAYREWKRNKFIVPQINTNREFALGNVQFIPVFDRNIWVANMIAQNDFLRQGDPKDKVYLDYDALNEALLKSFDFAKRKSLTIHMPRIGCGLAGGQWDLIEPLIEGHIVTYPVNVYVYDFE